MTSTLEYVVIANGKEKAVTLSHWRAAKVLRRCVMDGMAAPRLIRRTRKVGR